MAAGAGIRREQIRGFGLRAGEVGADQIADGSITPTELNASIYGGTPTSIDPDDAGSAGVATTLSRSDHQHAMTTGTPASVGTANAEGSGTGFARDTHVHDIGAGAIDGSGLFAAGVVNNAALGAGAVTPAKVTVNYARVRRAANQSLTNNTATDISFDTEDADPGGFWTAGTPTRLTVVTTGVVEVTCNVFFAANTTGRRVLLIVRNALEIVAGLTTDAIGTDPTRLSATTGPVPVSAADFFTFSVLQESGGALNIIDRTAATIRWLGV